MRWQKEQNHSVDFHKHVAFNDLINHKAKTRLDPDCNKLYPILSINLFLVWLFIQSSSSKLVPEHAVCLMCESGECAPQVNDMSVKHEK